MDVLSREQIEQIKNLEDEASQERSREIAEAQKAELRLETLQKRTAAFRKTLTRIVEGANSQVGRRMIVVGEPVDHLDGEFLRLPIDVQLPNRHVQLVLVIEEKGPAGKATIWRLGKQRGKDVLEGDFQLHWPDPSESQLTLQFRSMLSSLVLKAPASGKPKVARRDTR